MRARLPVPPSRSSMVALVLVAIMLAALLIGALAGPGFFGQP